MSTFSSPAPRASVLGALIESPLRALNIRSDILYWQQDEIDPLNKSFRDSSGFLDLRISDASPVDPGPGKIGNASQHIGQLQSQTHLDYALNLKNRSWTFRTWILGEGDPNPQYGTIVSIPGVFSLAGALYTGSKILNITRTGTIATATCKFPHHLTDGAFVTISGADAPEYEGTYAITVPAPETSPEVFEYTVTGTPATPETSAILKWKPFEFSETFQPEWSAFLTTAAGVFTTTRQKSASTVWLRLIIRFDAEALPFSLQQADNEPDVIDVTGETLDNFNRFIVSPGNFTVGRGFYLDETGLWLDYVWSEADATDDWNAGDGKTWPDVPNN